MFTASAKPYVISGKGEPEFTRHVLTCILEKLERTQVTLVVYAVMLFFLTNNVA